MIVVMGFALVSSFVPAFVEWAHNQDLAQEQRLADVPVLSDEALREEGKAVYDEVEGPLKSTHYEYLTLLARVYDYQDRWNKARFALSPERRIAHMGNSLPAPDPNWIQQSLTSRYLTYARMIDQKDFRAGEEQYKAEHGSLPGMKRYETIVDSSHAVELLRLGYAWSILFAVIFLGLRVHDKDARVMLEIHKIVVYAFVWPIMIWRYPTYLVRYDQVRRLLRFAAYSISSMLSMGAVGGVVKAAEKAKPEEGEASTLVAEDNPFSVHGFAQGAVSDGQDPSVGALRLQLSYTNGGMWKAFTEFEGVGATAPGANWLRVAMVSYTGDGWGVNVGRFAVAAAYPFPPPNKLVPMHYPWAPFSSYGWGVQLAWQFGPSVSLVADVTGQTGQPFDGVGNWSGVEASARLTWKLQHLTLGVTGQVGAAFGRAGLDLSVPLGRDVTLAGGIFGAHERTGDTLGGYALATWAFREDWNVHLQMDLAPEAAKVSAGIGWRTGKLGWSAKTDVEQNVRSGALGVYGLLQYAF